MIKATEPKNEVKTDITLEIEEEAYVEMMKYAHMFSPKECSGSGLVERTDYTDGSVTFTVKKVYLPNQTNTGGTTEVHEDEVNKVNTQIVNDGDDTALHKFHWHSHVDMGVFHSGIDDSNYDDMQTGDYVVSLVVNKRYEMLGSIHLYSPLRINVLNIEVEPPLIDFADYEVPEELQKKLEAGVARVLAYEKAQAEKRRAKHKGRVITPYSPNWNQNYGQQSWEDRGNDFGLGLAYDPDLIALLRAGEKENIITLFEDSGKDIIGYMNNRTFEYYEISSYRDNFSNSY